MSQEVSVDNGGPVYPKVELNFDGVFNRLPFCYHDGKKFNFIDCDFAGMDFHECIKFLERFMQQPISKLYYCIPNRPLYYGIRPINGYLEYCDFIVAAYEVDGFISIYVDHYGDELEGYFEDHEQPESENSKADSHASCVMAVGCDDEQGNAWFTDVEVKNDYEKEKEDNEIPNIEVEVPKNEADIPKNDDDMIDDDQPQVSVDVPILNKTSNDEFLSKLVVEDLDEATEDMNSTEADVDSQPTNEVHPIFNESIPWKQQKPILGVRFSKPSQLKHMLCNYAVANGYQLFYEKNDGKRLLVKCCKGECTFRLWASWMSDQVSFQIKSLNPEHNCGRNFNLGSLVTYKWLGSHYTKEILHRQKLSARKLRGEVIKKFGINVSIGQCRRAKAYALQLIEGTLVEHYAKLWSYAEELRRSNPGSTVKLDVNCMPDGKNYFSKFYVCFDGLKKGWKEGCRKIICLDGCFLKGLCKGELLTAVGRDANDHFYPIAWAVVCVENKENWKWFLENLIDDLDLELGINISLMSDQHKGSIEAVKEMLPYAEHRQCARHICANMKKRWNGAEYETLFWKASKSTTFQAFEAVMKEIELLNPHAHKYLMDKDPSTWSLAYFQPGNYCEAVENEMCESFNAVVSEKRKKPIITMLEEIRLYMMDRLYRCKIKGQKWPNQICPKIRLLVNELKIQQRNWHVVPSGLNHFEVRSTWDAYEVDLEKRTCSCRLWQVNGYGCVHFVACISFLNKDVEGYVDKMFHSSTYMKAYKYRIAGMNGVKIWPQTTYIPPLPPISRRMPGRPAVKRKRDATEDASRSTISKTGKKIRCNICKEPGHNKKSCKKTNNEQGKNVENVKKKVRTKKMKVKRGECSKGDVEADE